jgi:formylglycine-generating enzyme
MTQERVQPASPHQTPNATERPPRPERDMVWVPGGTFQMGSDRFYPEEAPVRKVKVNGFWIDTHTVTNDQFSRFVADAGHVTLAEKPANPDDYPGAKPELLEPSSVVFRKPATPVDMNNAYNWWTYVKGANWRNPRGPGTTIDGLGQHPVVHVAFEDVEAYAKWAGMALPTEAEWEFAARGGIEGADYSWGNDFAPDGKLMANTWQGRFPYQNLLEDGYEWTAPVGTFPANGYGLYDMAGNVWQWTTDWYQPHEAIVKACCTLDNPHGGDRDRSIDPRDVARIPRRVMKGGSYLCAPNYCHRYRPAARMAQAIDTATCHVGFRCIIRG